MRLLLAAILVASLGCSATPQGGSPEGGVAGSGGAGGPGRDGPGQTAGAGGGGAGQAGGAGAAGRADGGAGDSGRTGCGDGILQGSEACDDGNNTAGDGCAADCRTIERDHACPTPGMPCVSTVVCGDGRISGEETCDDGNARAGDGCGADCRREPGFSCPAPGQRCTAARCGDGIIAGAEECEDGNAAGGDGCSAMCRLEPGFSCPTPGQPCRATTCGDAMREGSEPCDDGNQVVGDGCNPFCEVEPTCGAMGCSSRCGDGMLLPGDNEQCDDGNTRAGDGCSPTCMVEPGFMCTSMGGAPAATIEVPITYRDFIARPAGGGTRHPDFEVFTGTDPTTGLVAAALGADRKPVYTGICGATTTLPSAACPFGQETTTAANFDQWYRDTAGVNLSFVRRLTLARQADGSYYFPDAAFFPLDNLGWVAMGRDTPSMGHNFGFTSEVRSWFEFRGGEELRFSGDDDVWIFVHGQLVVDLGGLHPSRAGSVTLDTARATQLGLQMGRVYEIALFHAERRTDQSNFNLTLKGFGGARSACTTRCGDGVVAGDETCDDGRNDGSYGSCTADCQRGPRCGDGTVQMPQETCDDGTNLTTYSRDGAGCAPGCRAPATCGDGMVDSLFGEQCDDGRAQNTGGYGKCKADCSLGPRCGDGVRQADDGEACDDGNQVNGDGCSADCREGVGIAPAPWNAPPAPWR